VNAMPFVTQQLDALFAENPEKMKRLCEEIKAPDFYDVAKALDVPILRSRAMVTWCSGIAYQRQTLKPAAPKPAAEKPSTAFPPLPFGEALEEEFDVLKKAKKAAVQQDDANGTETYEKKAKVIEARLKLAKEFYDNLSVAFAGMREDLKEVTGFRVFDPFHHESNPPDEYLRLLTKALEQETPHILTPASYQQIEKAKELLNSAMENLDQARIELAALNREMMQLSE